MKLNSCFFLVLAMSSMFFISCTSAPKEEVVDPNFIGDYGPIQLENIICIRESMGNLVPTEVEVYFIPRTNVVEMYLRDGMTSYVLLFEGNDRQEVAQGIEMYASAYTAYSDGDKSALAEREPNRKNYFNEGSMSVSWGVASAARNNTTVFQTNYKYLEKNRPYFELLVDKTKDKKNSSVYSPVLRLYFSPTHLESVMSQLNQEYLESLVADLEAEAFAF